MGTDDLLRSDAAPARTERPALSCTLNSLITDRVPDTALSLDPPMSLGCERVP